MAASVQLGGHGASILLSVDRYESASPTGDWPEWLIGSVEIEIADGEGAFRDARSVNLTAQALARFRDEIGVLDKTLSGSVVLDAIERDLELELELKNGRGTLSGRAFTSTCSLCFTSEIDQSYLRPILGGLEEITRAFPVRS